MVSSSHRGAPVTMATGPARVLNAWTICVCLVGTLAGCGTESTGRVSTDGGNTVRLPDLGLMEDKGHTSAHDDSGTMLTDSGTTVDRDGPVSRDSATGFADSDLGACRPVCVARLCGSSDGCNDSCRPGSGCCTPNCSGKCAGDDDGCEGTCEASDCAGCCTADHQCLLFAAQTHTQCGNAGGTCVDCRGQAKVCDSQTRGCAANKAVFVSQSVPTTLVPGARATVTVTMRNTGESTWTAAHRFRLGAQNPHDNHTWGPSRILLPPGEVVGPGAEKTFSFKITAPATAGTYDFQWRMLLEGVEWFGDRSANVRVKVWVPRPAWPKVVAGFHSNEDIAGGCRAFDSYSACVESFLDDPISGIDGVLLSPRKSDAQLKALVLRAHALGLAVGMWAEQGQDASRGMAEVKRQATLGVDFIEEDERIGLGMTPSMFNGYKAAARAINPEILVGVTEWSFNLAAQFLATGGKPDFIAGESYAGSVPLPSWLAAAHNAGVRVAFWLGGGEVARNTLSQSCDVYRSSASVWYFNAAGFYRTIMPSLSSCYDGR